jgi:hypothetical protein
VDRIVAGIVMALAAQDGPYSEAGSAAAAGSVPVPVTPGTDLAVSGTDSQSFASVIVQPKKEKRSFPPPTSQPTPERLLRNRYDFNEGARITLPLVVVPHGCRP